MLWLVGDPAPERSKALLACLSRAGKQGRAVYDASRDLELAAASLSQSIFAAGSALPPLISIDLKEDQAASLWSRGNRRDERGEATRRAGRPALHGDDPYPRMIVAARLSKRQRRPDRSPGSWTSWRLTAAGLFSSVSTPCTDPYQRARVQPGAPDYRADFVRAEAGDRDLPAELGIRADPGALGCRLWRNREVRACQRLAKRHAGASTGVPRRCWPGLSTARAPRKTWSRPTCLSAPR